MERLRFGGLVAATILGVLGVVTAAGGPKPQPVPATMTFRCVAGGGGSPSCDDLDISGDADRVRDDGDGSYIGGSIDPSGVFNVNFAHGTRILNLFLGGRLSDRPCTATHNCHPLDLANTDLALNYFDIKVKPLTANGSQDLAGGLYAMTSCGPLSVYPALVHYTFWLPDGDGHWGLNFNPKAYPGTTAANLVRWDNGTWTVEANAGFSTAELLSWGHSGITRHNGPSHEGFFDVRFKLTIAATAPLPSGVGRCN